MSPDSFSPVVHLKLVNVFSVLDQAYKHVNNVNNVKNYNFNVYW